MGFWLNIGSEPTAGSRVPTQLGVAYGAMNPRPFRWQV